MQHFRVHAVPAAAMANSGSRLAFDSFKIITAFIQKLLCLAIGSKQKRRVSRVLVNFLIVYDYRPKELNVKKTSTI